MPFGPGRRNTGSWQTAGSPHGEGWIPGQGQPAQGQPGPNGAAGSWQAAGPRPDQAYPGPYSPGGRADGGWPRAAPGAGPGQRNSGSGQAPGPGPGQGWTTGPGRGNRDTGSWQAASPQPGPGRAPGQAPSQEQFGAGQFNPGSFGPEPFGYGQAGPDQFGPGQPGRGFRNTGSWQAAGAGQAGPGQPPHASQPYPGQQYAGGTADGPGRPDSGGFGRVGSPVIRQRDSALPDPPPSAKGPVAAIENDNVAAFARDLRVLRSKARLDYPDMAEKSHYTMRTLASAAGGLRLPTLPVLIAYVNACDGDVADWEERWGRLTKSGKKGLTALPPVGPEPGSQSGPGPIPTGARQTGEIYVITSAPQRDAQW
jgi:hypothetical protein